MSPEHDLLLDPFSSIYAVNCRIEDDVLQCGALYLEPKIVFKTIRLADEAASVMVELPDELLNQPQPCKVWSIELPISNV